MAVAKRDRLGLSLFGLLSLAFGDEVRARSAWQTCASRGASIGHVSPEAAAGGEIALIQEGDTIAIDIPNSKVNVKVSDEELEARRAKFVPREPNVKSARLVHRCAAHFIRGRTVNTNVPHARGAQHLV